MEETIELIKQGTNAAEMALLDSTKLLDDVIEGNVKLDREGGKAWRRLGRPSRKLSAICPASLRRRNTEWDFTKWHNYLSLHSNILL